MIFKKLESILVSFVDSKAFKPDYYDLLIRYKNAKNEGNSTLPTISDKLNIMESIHNRKHICIIQRVKGKRC
jgi:hypothetical protein